MRRACAIPAMLVLCALATGCVRRTISITSTPSEALVFVNEREVGRTPCEVDFLFYGVYDVRLKLDGYESIVGSGTASAPFWDFIGADLVTEIAPLPLESRVEWHFEFVPADNSLVSLLERARSMRTAVHEGTTLDDASAAVRAAGADAAKRSSKDATEGSQQPAPMGSGEAQGALPAAGPAVVPKPGSETPPPVP